MNGLTFSMLALQFFKYQQNLLNSGLQFKLEEGNNLYRDTIILFRQDYIKTFYLTISAHLWDRFRQFTLYTSNTGKYHYRLNPVNNEPYRIPTTDSMSLMCSQEIPDELRIFGQEILIIIRSLEDRLRYDKLAQDGAEIVT